MKMHRTFAPVLVFPSWDREHQLTVVPTAERKMVDRQDDQLVTDVKQALTKEAALKTAAIDVRAEKGIVILTGKAQSLATSVRASEAHNRHQAGATHEGDRS